MSEFLENNNGEKSSKRLWGSILIGAGIVFSAVLFGWSLEHKAKDAATALSIINAFLISGSGLLGIGVVELFGKIKNVKKIKETK